jgi:uroporphyrinogen decarboxylase
VETIADGEAAGERTLDLEGWGRRVDEPPVADQEDVLGQRVRDPEAFRQVERARAMGADGVFMTDDWGSQSGLLIAPDLWRRLFKSYYATVFAEVHRLGMDVLFHSCGNVTDIVGDLIDAGMDVLDPVQPGAMDIDRLAREFGGKTAFSGAIDIQHLLCEGTPREIKDEVRRIVDTLGRPFGGSLLLGPANVMTPETPLENLRALFEASHDR